MRYVQESGVRLPLKPIGFAVPDSKARTIGFCRNFAQAGVVVVQFTA